MIPTAPIVLFVIGLVFIIASLVRGSAPLFIIGLVVWLLGAFLLLLTPFPV